MNLLKFGLLAFVTLELVSAQEEPVCPDGVWMGWYDRDNPGGVGDFEDLATLRIQNRDLCAQPIAIDVTLTTGGPIPANQVVHISLSYGFSCINNRQPRGQRCLDYRVRFCCPRPRVCKEPYSWTDWIDLDDPEGTGDRELLSAHVATDPDEYCEKPINIDATLTDGRPYQLGMDNLAFFTAAQGLQCNNIDQPGDKCCADYQVRYCCKLCRNETSADPTDDSQALAIASALT